MKKTWLAVLISIFFPGVGHMYLGKVAQGVMVIIALITLGFFVSDYPWVAILSIILYIYTIISAAKNAKYINSLAYN